jgi:hypothetical protein
MTHKHQCETCRVVWEHPEARWGDEKAHTCPACKKVLGGYWEWYKGCEEPHFVEMRDGTLIRVREVSGAVSPV